MKVQRRGALRALGALALGRTAMAADTASLDGLWTSDGVPAGGASWRWTLRLQGYAVSGEVERQTGALPVQRWRLQGRRQGASLRLELRAEAGRPGASAQAQWDGAERLTVMLRWPDGWTERVELIRP